MEKGIMFYVGGSNQLMPQLFETFDKAIKFYNSIPIKEDDCKLISVRHYENGKCITEKTIDTFYGFIPLDKELAYLKPGEISDLHFGRPGGYYKEI